jgi:hypothetical protein
MVAIFAGLGYAARGAARTEETLLWDDGSAESHISYSSRGMAVWFQAPGWARYVTRVQIYVGDDGDPSTSAPFDMSVRHATGTWPYQPGDAAWQVASGDDYQEVSWVEFAVDPPLDIESDVQFPERVFFVMVNWVEFGAPAVGWDTDPPHHDTTMIWFEGTWGPLNGVDGMIRAVVSDADTAVEGSSWAAIKALYR